MTTLSILHITSYAHWANKMNCFANKHNLGMGVGLWFIYKGQTTFILLLLFTFYYLVVVWPYLNWPLADTESLFLSNPMCFFRFLGTDCFWRCPGGPGSTMGDASQVDWVFS